MSQQNIELKNRICKFCDTEDGECFEYDKHNVGFWYEVCDGYNYLSGIVSAFID